MVEELRHFLLDPDPEHKAFIYIYYSHTAGFYIEITPVAAEILVRNADQVIHGYNYKYYLEGKKVYIRFLRYGE